MALGDPYASGADLAARIDEADNGTFEPAIDAASRDIERFTGRQFNKTDVATARTYRPTLGIVILDDFWTTEDLIVETDNDNDGTFETVWSAADYELEPANSVDGYPFSVINAVGSKRFPDLVRRSVRVTAKWGWADVPPGIREATLAVAEEIITGKSGALASESIDGYSYSFAHPGGSELLGPRGKAAPYRRMLGFA